jgi:hypothetical protein
MREELQAAVDQLPQTGHQARAVHGRGGEADHQPPRHCWEQVRLQVCLYFQLIRSTKQSALRLIDPFLIN